MASVSEIKADLSFALDPIMQMENKQDAEKRLTALERVAQDSVDTLTTQVKHIRYLKRKLRGNLE